MKNVQDIYSLSPMQQGLLFHALSDSANGAYVERVSWLLHGKLDVEAYRAAWEQVIKRHPILSTSFHYQDLDEPVQVVRKTFKLPWHYDDWRGLSVSEQEQRFGELLKDERRRGFKLNSAPMMRLTLLRLQPDLHRFLWSYHHLLLDGWSISLVLRDVLEAYERLRRAQPLPPGGVRPYRDYIGWLQKQDVKAAETFWREKLRGFSVPTKLGIERSTASSNGTPGERYRKLHRVLSVETTTALQSLARQQQLTLSPMIHAAWSLLLSRYSGEREVLFGSVVSGRPTALAGAETMVGLFINTLPVRVAVSGDVSLLEWLRQLQSQQVELQQYEYSSLRQVQRWSEVRNGQPLFDSVVVVRNLPIDESLRQEGAETEVRDLCHHEMATGHPLTLGVVLEQGLRLQLTYDSERYDDESIQRMLGHLEHLLEEMVAHPERRVGELSLLTAAEERYLRDEVNATAREFATELLTHELFEQQVERTPDALALRAGERELSYRELNEEANRVAHLLRERGVGVGELVAVCLERTAASVIALLGIWKAGAAYLPLDVEQPSARLQLMVAEAAPVLVLTTAALKERLGLEGALCLDQEGHGLKANPSDGAPLVLDAHLNPSSLAYVIYTSGSTGRPKGVMVEHGQLQNTLLAAQEFYRFTAADAMACVAPFAFDISLFELLSPLLVGGRVILVGGREMLEPEAAGAVLREVTFLHSAPGLMRQLAGYMKAPNEAGTYEQIRGVMVGGDAVSPELLEQLREALPQAQLYVGYGPTEAAIMCAAYPVPKEETVEQRMLGYPLANTKLRLYDTEQQLVPVGVVGEVYIGGASVGRGYLQSEELTKEKFVEVEGERWYRSGDLGRRLPDGSIAFVGRADGQVKVRGYRIEVGEVEAALESAEGVRAAAVALKQDARGEGRLVGYVVLEEGAEFNQGELRRQAAERLPEYMVPVVLVELQELPLTPLAKVDRKALPEIDNSSFESAQSYVEPHTPVEEMLADVWAATLKLDQVGAHDNFFELGGDSLLATQLVARVRERLQVEVALRELFEQPTVAGFAKRVEAALRAEAGVTAPPIGRVERHEEMVLSFAQQRLWFIEQLRPGSPLYNMPHAVRMLGQLNVEVLEQTVTEIVRRHEILRTTFKVNRGNAVQVVHPPSPLQLAVIDLSGVDQAAREEEARRLITHDSTQPFDLINGPLLRVGVIKLDEAEHITFFTTHHIISDGWSVNLLIREVVALYTAFSRNEPSPLPELPIQYADFATWQREWLQGEVLEKQVAYWREQLAGAPAVLELPLDHPRPAVQSHRGARQSFTLPEELKQGLEELSRREGVTLFMTLLSAWQTLLLRYSGQQDIVVGIPVANRQYRETESLIGFFVNMLAMRTDLSGNPSFRELLQRVREVALGAYAHQDLPFEKLVEELQPVRSMSHTPVFQVIFGLENLEAGALKLPELELSLVDQHTGTAIFDLSLGMAETSVGLGGILEYNTDVFERETIERMVVHYRELLAGIVADPEQRVGELSLLTAAEERYLRDEVNSTAREFATELLTHELFEQQVERTPSAIALRARVAGETAGVRELSYRELNEEANRVAHLLRERGVGVGELVAVCLERTAESVIALLGIWKAGAAYLPLDVEQPSARLQMMVAEAAPVLVLTTAALKERLDLEGALCLDQEGHGLKGNPSDGAPLAEGVDLNPSSLAYVIYTSGSTGRPKGVMVEHGQLRNTLLAAQEFYKFTAADTMACVAPFAFDISLFELLSPLLVGGRVILVGGREMLEPEAARAVLREVTFLHSAPGLMRQLAGYMKAHNEAGAYEQIRGVMVGGDAVSPELLEQLREALPQAQLYVGYGPTEAAIMCAAYPVSKEGGVEQRMLGYPLANTKLRLYDTEQQLVPVGVVGEVYIGGASVGRGYLQSEELTREKFVEVEEERWYRSGDLGRRMPDGSIAFVGRADGQVKVRGYRIEVGEVEAALESAEGVRAAAVALKQDARGEGRLVGYVVLEEGAEFNQGELRRQAAERLPEYMVPVVLMELKELPLTPLAKVDRKALPEIEQVQREREYEAPRTAVEEVLCDIWSEVLQVERVGVTESFFELGGHSLLATQLMSRVRETLQVEVALRELFEQPTVAGFAERVEAALRAGAGVSAPPIKRVERHEEMVLSFAQQRLWFIEQLRPGTALYNSTEKVRLSGQLNLAALESTLTEIVRRHEVLRTTFREVNGQPVQVVHPPASFKLTVIDISDLPEPQRDEEAQRLTVQEAQEPFDLSTGPLLRVKLLRLAANEYLLLHTMHHIVSDGWSMGVLMREVAALYPAYVKGEKAQLPELQVQYADFAAWQREWLQGEVLEKQVGYWRQQLAGAPAVLELPLDHARPAVQSHRGSHYQMEIPAALTESLRELSRREGVTLFMTLLSAWQTLLLRYSGQADVVVGTTIAGRNRRETENLIGFFVNTLVLRTDLGGNPSFRELLKRVREVALGAYAHQDLPFEKLVEELQPVRSMSHTPLFQVMFGLENVPREPLQLPELELTPLPGKDETAKFELSLAMQEDGDVVGGLLGYNTDVFERETIERMAVHFRELLAGIVADPEQRVGELRLLTAAEERYLSEEVNSTAREFATELLTHELFEQQVERTPDALALRAGEQELSYRELNEEANRVAHLLRERGVGVGELVAVCLERTAASVIALLGIWKAGAAYLPLDVEQPSARLQLMVAEAAPVLVLTTETIRERLGLEGALCLDQEGHGLKGNPSDRAPLVLDAHLTPRSLAYVIYTSGSTGRPKGVMVEHGQLQNTLLAAQEFYKFTAADAMACVAPFAFDISLFELLSPLLVGGRVILVGGREMLEPEAAGAVLREVTFLHSAPGLMRQLAGYMKAHNEAGAYKQIRGVMVGGDAVSPELLEQLREALPQAQLYVGYGPTEAAIMCAAYPVSKEGGVEQRMLGYPLANTKLRLYDTEQQLAPVGVVGEVYIGGASVGRGYLQSEELTREKFVEVEGERWYRSGDLGRRLPDGSIAFVGRADGQVKVRGYRIEVGEVEAALESAEGVRAVAVALKQDARGEGRLVGYVVLEEGAEFNQGELRRQAAERLPEYMVPVVLVELKELPLTPLAKVDRKALPEIEQVQREREYEAPRTAMEEVLCDIWSEVLQVERVGVSESFFELGGHSLLATQLMSRVRETLQVEVALRELFEQPTVAGFAERVEAALRAGAGVSAPPIRRVERHEEMVLSFAQQRLWFIEQLRPGSSIYNMLNPVQLRGTLDVEALAATFTEIVKRHEMLRTTFREVAGQAVQVIHPAEPVPLTMIDISELSATERAAELKLLVQREAEQPFDLDRGPLLRATLIRLAPEEHVVLLTMHHIVSDGWSMGVLTREVAALYGAYVKGEKARLPELQVQYADFATWQREWLQGEVLERQVGYWREQLKGAPAVLELPLDHARPAVQSHRGARQSFTLPEELQQGLEALSRREGVTLFMTLLSAWQTLLLRYSGQSDIVVGTTIAGRNRRETENLIGFFVNTLVLRTDLGGNPSFRELLKRVREVALGAYAHQDLPFEKLVEELQPVRSMSHTPFFQVTFGLENMPREAMQLPGLELSMVPQQTETAHFDLSMGMAETSVGLGGILEYNTDVFERETIERMVVHYRELLAGIVADPEQRVGELRLLTAAEEQYLSEEVNNTAREFATELLTHELFEQQVERTPDAVALRAGERELSYRELNEEANRVAHLLRERGVRSGELVAVCLERTAASVIALLGIWKAGAAYLPLDVEQPSARLQLMVAEAAPVLVLTTETIRERLGLEGALCLDQEGHGLKGNPSDRAPLVLDAHLTPRSLAYVIYTSGSTGRPKGVMVEHGQLRNTLLAAQEFYRLREAEVMACIAPFTFDISLFELLSPLLVGGRAILVGGREMLEPETASAVLSEVTFLHAVPGLMRQLIGNMKPHGESDANGTAHLESEDNAKARTGERDYKQIRGVMVGGDAVSPELLEQLREALPQAQLYVGYGPTEAAIMCAAYPVPKEGGVEQRMLGYPLANTKLRLYEVRPADEMLADGTFADGAAAISSQSAHMAQGRKQLVPVGVVGEVYIGGASVGRGYLQSEELTREKFVEVEGERWYRSGDLGRRLPDGSIAFVGRADGQVKVRGYRIEVGEVEAALESAEGVRAAAVALKQDARGEGRLVGYVVLEEGAEFNQGELRRQAAERLPEYMVPVVLVELKELPLTPLAKVDRKALPEIEQVQREREYEAPRTAVEEVLCDIWSEVLQVERVGVTESFFELGGHSLLATQLMSRVRETLQVEVALRELFEQPTVAGFAERVEAALRAGAGVSAPPIKRVERHEEMVLSFAQQRLWFIEQLRPGSSIYNMLNPVQLRGTLDVEALAGTFTEIVKRHEMLRTTFREVAGQAVQVIHPAEPVPLTMIDISELGATERAAELKLLVQREAEQPFDLDRGPLLRATLIRLAPEEHVVLLTMHHIVSDGWSMGVLTREVAALYGAYVKGEKARLPELQVQYADFATWQREWLQGEVLEKQVGYWREQLKGAPAVLELPLDHARPAVQSHRGARQSFTLPEELKQGLEALSRREGVTLFMTLLSAWQTLLLRYSGQSDIVVGTTIAGRNRRETENLIGFFVNTLVLRTDLGGNPSFRELLKRVREVALGAYAHQDLPFEKLVEELQPVRSMSHTPFFQVTFGLENMPREAMQLPGLELSMVPQQTETAHFDLSMGMAETSAGLGGILEYNTDVFERETIERMVVHYRELLAGIVADPEQRLGELRLLTAAEEQYLSEEVNSTAREFATELLTHELFEQQVERTPDALALRAGERELSYRELNEEANRVAHLLRERGVGVGELVAVCLERTAASVIALLGIWKAGAAYLPLDVEQPSARLQLMVAEATPVLVLTTAALKERLGLEGALCLDQEGHGLKGNPSDRAPLAEGVDLNPRSLAYVIYTSGSTGRPKGVMVEHGQLQNTLLAAQEFYRFTAADTMACVAPFAFDISLFELLSPLLVGGRVILVGGREMLEPEAAGAVLREVTFLHSAPGLMRQLAGYMKAHNEAGAYEQIRGVMVGGDAVSPELLEQLREALPQAQLYVGYGPTEAAIMCAAYPVPKEGGVEQRMLGYPLANTKLRLYDPEQQLAPVGVVGEVYIGGASVGRGYLQSEELTREKFVEVEGERWYRSGDLGRRLPDGSIAFVGRADGQVKVRGYRIEVGEVEAALESAAGVRAAAVALKQDARGEGRLVGYVVLEEGAEFNQGELRRQAAERLPEYMVPVVLVELKELPLTPLAKVDRKALPEIEQVQREREYEAPRTAVEEVLCDIWSEVLQVERVGVTESFFELGGHSLLATQLMSRVRDAFQIELPLRTLFEKPTVAELALKVEEALIAEIDNLSDEEAQAQAVASTDETDQAQAVGQGD